MFEEKIKLNPIEIDNVVEKDIYGQKVKFNKYLDQNLCVFITQECLEKFIEFNNNNEGFMSGINSIMPTLNICLCHLTTNIDIDDIAYEDLNAMGVFKEIRETLINYDEIKDTVISCISLMFDYVIYNAFDKLPTSKGMAENLSEIKEIFASNPTKAKEFANIVIANHPELKGFGEIFEKFLNNLNEKKE